MIKLNNVKINDKNISINFNLEIQPKEFVAIIGDNGAGKSTLLNVIAGFEKIDAGTLILNNENHTSTTADVRPVSILFQDNNIFEHLTVLENIGLGLSNKKLTQSQITLTTDIATKLKINQYLHITPATLSGGEKQKVAIARSLLRNTPILLLDEPFAALDKGSRHKMVTLLKEIHQQQKLTILMVTHQPEEIASLITKTIIVNKGQIVI